MRALQDDELQTVKGFLVQGDYDLSDDATLGKDFWRSLRAKHKEIADKLMYQKACIVPNALINEVYEHAYTDSLQCFVNYIVTSIGIGKKVSDAFMESLDDVIRARAGAGGLGVIIDERHVAERTCILHGKTEKNDLHHDGAARSCSVGRYLQFIEIAKKTDIQKRSVIKVGCSHGQISFRVRSPLGKAARDGSPRNLAKGAGVSFDESPKQIS